jgi:hypothetical protein
MRSQHPLKKKSKIKLQVYRKIISTLVSILHVVQTGSGVHPTSYPIGTGGSFSGIKQLEHEADNSPPFSVEVKKMYVYTFTLPYAFMA